jgi:hypothetical protein
MLPWQIETALDSLYKDWRAFIGIKIGPKALLYSVIIDYEI